MMIGQVSRYCKWFCVCLLGISNSILSQDLTLNLIYRSVGKLAILFGLYQRSDDQKLREVRIVNSEGEIIAKFDLKPWRVEVVRRLVFDVLLGLKPNDKIVKMCLKAGRKRRDPMKLTLDAQRKHIKKIESAFKNRYTVLVDRTIKFY